MSFLHRLFLPFLLLPWINQFYCGTINYRDRTTPSTIISKLTSSTVWSLISLEAKADRSDTEKRESILSLKRNPSSQQLDLQAVNSKNETTYFYFEYYNTQTCMGSMSFSYGYQTNVCLFLYAADGVSVIGSMMGFCESGGFTFSLYSDHYCKTYVRSIGYGSLNTCSLSSEPYGSSKTLKCSTTAELPIYEDSLVIEGYQSLLKNCKSPYAKSQAFLAYNLNNCYDLTTSFYKIQCDTKSKTYYQISEAINMTYYTSNTCASSTRKSVPVISMPNGCFGNSSSGYSTWSEFMSTSPAITTSAARRALLQSEKFDSQIIKNAEENFSKATERTQSQKKLSDAYDEGAFGMEYIKASCYNAPAYPSSEPSSQPSRHPSRQPSKQPSTRPSSNPSSNPSPAPTPSPTHSPSKLPTLSPSFLPSHSPTKLPSVSPSQLPTPIPTKLPTKIPSLKPSYIPSVLPSVLPTQKPSNKPSTSPTHMPTLVPSKMPTEGPSDNPTRFPNDITSDSPSLLPTRSPSFTLDYACLHNTSWLINTNNHSNAHFAHAKTDIASSLGSVPASTWTVSFSGIPNFDKSFTYIDTDTLNLRPKASTDFTTNSQTTAVDGHFYVFGDNIGYNTSSSKSCKLGYWPPGNTCPTVAEYTKSFPLQPTVEASSAGCKTTASASTAVGYAVNGVGLYNYKYEDQSTYLNLGVWTNNAVNFGKYDTDICGGHVHAAEYHIHKLSSCLSEKINDIDVSSSNGPHSSVFGWIIDGFPIYGPYNGKGRLAKSCWQKRDYTSSNSLTRCTGGKRTCQLVDQFDISKGTQSTTSTGPTFTATITTQSGITITAENGVFLEDYFYNSTCTSLGEEYLNAYNGHDHGDLGFHYHFTAEYVSETGVLNPSFPYITGPKYYGCVSTSLCSNSVCGSTLARDVDYSSCVFASTYAPTKSTKVTMARVVQTIEGFNFSSYSSRSSIFDSIFTTSISNVTSEKITPAEILDFNAYRYSQVNTTRSSSLSNITVLSYSISFLGTENFNGYDELRSKLLSDLQSSNFTAAVDLNAQTFGIYSLNRISTLSLTLENLSPSAAPTFVKMFPSPTSAISAQGRATGSDEVLDDGSIAGITWGGVFVIGVFSFLVYRYVNSRNTVSPGSEDIKSVGRADPRKLTANSAKSLTSVMPGSEQF